MSHTAAQRRPNAPAADPKTDAPAADPKTEPKPETDAQKAERELLEAVRGFTATPAMVSPDGQRGESDGTLMTLSQPTRTRKNVQVAMDQVARQAYADWVKAGRPTIWQRMPVITYFLKPEEVAKYKTWIRKTQDPNVVTPEPYTKDNKRIEPSGVRVRFGTDFVLTEALAEKIGQKEHVGKTVVAWAVIDKRANTKK